MTARIPGTASSASSASARRSFPADESKLTIPREHLTGEDGRGGRPISTPSGTSPRPLARGWEVFAENLNEKFGGPNGIRTRVWALPRFRQRYQEVGACLVHERGDRPQTCRSIRPLKLAAGCPTRLESVRSGATRSDRPQTCRPRMADSFRQPGAPLLTAGHGIHGLA